MAIYVIGGSDTSELWQIDTDRGTVVPLKTDGGENSIDPESLEKIQAMRTNGFAVVKGVNFAVAVIEGSDLTYRQLTGNI